MQQSFTQADSGMLCPGLERVACGRRGQWLYLFGEDGGIVYSETQRRFAGLDATGVAVYLARDAGLPADETIPAPAEVVATIHALVEGVFPAAGSRLQWPAVDPDQPAAPGGMTLDMGGDLPISVHYPEGPAARLGRDVFHGCEPATGAARCRLDARRTATGWCIFINDRPWMPFAREEQLGLGLLHAARSVLYELGDYDIAFHAAMVAWDDCGLLLCAPQESGKSTLAAHLVARGFDLIADEPALLQVDSWTVQPFGLPISLKAGSWPVLTSQFPALEAAPVHTRSDGMEIKLLTPGRASTPPQRRSLTRIIFPRYRPAEPARLERLSVFETLRLLDAGGMLLARELPRGNFEAFLRGLHETPAFRLTYSSSVEAEQLLGMQP